MRQSKVTSPRSLHLREDGAPSTEDHSLQNLTSRKFAPPRQKIREEIRYEILANRPHGGFLIFRSIMQRLGKSENPVWIITGWRKLIGSPKLQNIFHKRATKYMSLLRKMTCKDKGSYEFSPPCTTGSYLCTKYVCPL